MQSQTKLLTKRQTADIHRMMDRFGSEHPSDYPKIAAAFMKEIEGRDDAERLTFQLITWAVSVYFSRDRQKTKKELKFDADQREEEKALAKRRRADRQTEERKWVERGIDPADHEAKMAYISAAGAEARTEHEKEIIHDFLSRWKLGDGSSLGDANRVQLVKAARKERNSADGHAKNAKFYMSLADRMKGRGSVREEIGLNTALEINADIYQA